MATVFIWLVYLSVCVAFGITKETYELRRNFDTWSNARNNCLPGRLAQLPESNLTYTGMEEGDAAWINVQEYIQKNCSFSYCFIGQIQYRSPEERFAYYVNGESTTSGKNFKRTEILDKMKSGENITAKNIERVLRGIPGSSRFWIPGVDIKITEMKCLALLQGENGHELVSDDCSSQHFYICETDPDLEDFQPTIRRVLAKTVAFNVTDNLNDSSNSSDSDKMIMILVVTISGCFVAIVIVVIVAVFVKRRKQNTYPWNPWKVVCTDKNVHINRSVESEQTRDREMGNNKLPVEPDGSYSYSYVTKCANERTLEDDEMPSYDSLFIYKDSNVEKSTGNVYDHVIAGKEDQYDTLKTANLGRHHLCTDNYSKVALNAETVLQTSL